MSTEVVDESGTAQVDQDKVCRFFSAQTENDSDHINTHCAHVFLVGDHAFKIKRNVKYNYLDMTTLAKRKSLLDRELELNQPVLPDIYQSVVPVSVDASGSLAMDGKGEVIEWALKMKRFPQSRVIENIAIADGLSEELAKSIGQSVSEYHRSLRPEPVKDGYARVHEVYEELLEALGALGSCFTAESLEQFRISGQQELAKNREILDKRARDGHIKRCHGDLHLRNLLLTDSGPQPFDALEFDERMATTDVLYDLAFLLMDLGHRDLAAHANIVLNEYVLQMNPEHCRGIANLPLFLYLRAGIKAMTTAQAALYDADNAEALNSDARTYLADAIAYLQQPAPQLIAIGGLSGTGKSSISRALAVRSRKHPGAIVLRSDAERKRLFGVKETEHLPDDHYTPANAKRNYDNLFEKAEALLEAGASVILDAVFLEEHLRSRAHEAANRARADFSGCWLEAPSYIMTSRLEQRQNDASDADARVLHKQMMKSAGVVTWQHIDANQPLEKVVDAVMESLQ